MFGIIFGLGCLYLFFRLQRHHRYAFGGHAGCGSTHHPDREGRHRHGGRGRGPMRARVLRRVLRKIDATPEQATEIEAAFDELRAEVEPLRSIVRGSKDDFAAALREDELGVERLDAAFALHRDALETAQKAVHRALARLHDVLEPGQRALIADHFSRFSSRHVGPYR